MTPLKVGDRVAYTRKFCQSTGILTGAVPFARGAIQTVYTRAALTRAVVKWDVPSNELPDIVNIYNLIREDELHLEPV